MYRDVVLLNFTDGCKTFTDGCEISLTQHGSTQKNPHRVRFRTFLGDSVCIVFHRARPVDFFFIHLRFFRQFQPLRLNTFPRSCLGDHSFGWIVSKLRTESDGPCDGISDGPSRSVTFASRSVTRLFAHTICASTSRMGKQTGPSLNCLPIRFSHP